MQMLAIGGIEILIGATALLTLLAVVAFFMGDKKERAATETSPGADEPEGEAQTEDEPEAKTAGEGSSDPEPEPAAEPLMAKLSGDPEVGKPKSVLPDLPKLDGSKDKESKPILPTLPLIATKADEAEPAAEDDLERKFIEKRLQRMADKRAGEKQDEPDELPGFPTGPPKSKPAADLPKPVLIELPQAGEDALVPELPAKPESIKEKPDLPQLPKPDLPDTPKPPADRPDLPPLPAKAKVEAEAEAAPPGLPKRGGDLPPLPDSPSVEDEADLQTREQEREV